MNEHRDASNRLTYDFNEIDAGSYSQVTKAVVGNFKLEPANKITRGLDQIFQDFKQGSRVIGLEWDNWSGYIVSTKTKESESLAKEIANYINAKFNS